MPTLKPRISITLEAHDLSVLDRYAAASGKPRASLIAQLITATVPELQRAAELMELANAAPAGVIKGLVDDLNNATADAMGFLKPFNDDYQLVLNGLDVGLADAMKAHQKSGRDAAVESGAAATSSAARTRSRRRSDPHLLTGGSK